MRSELEIDGEAVIGGPYMRWQLIAERLVIKIDMKVCEPGFLWHELFYPSERAIKMRVTRMLMLRLNVDGENCSRLY